MTRYETVRSTGAWDRWRDEIRAGRRTDTTPTDALYFAAFCDSIGLDRLDTGDLDLAVIWFDESAAHLLRGASKVAAA